MDYKKEFDESAEYAKKFCTCNKVAVGAKFITNDGREFYSCNRSEEHDCTVTGKCHKFEVTGIYESCEETRKYCSAVHAEINMINKLRENNVDPSDGILFVSRYPCHNCCEKCIEFGFKRINYCGRQEISDEVKELFSTNDVEVNWFKEYDYEE